jgi:hypothetical protein
MRLYNNVNAGTKALYIPGGNSGRRNADVLIASQFRRYYEFKSWQNQRHDQGVCFFPVGGSMIENFPKLHSHNCTTKHQNTKSYFKPMVRIFKNMRNTMLAKGLLADGVAPSYFIEGMLFNVPNEKFGGTYQQTWINCFNHIVTADPEKLVCANRMHSLVRDSSPTSWPVANFNTFTAALKRYWESLGYLDHRLVALDVGKSDTTPRWAAADVCFGSNPARLPVRRGAAAYGASRPLPRVPAKVSCLTT